MIRALMWKEYREHRAIWLTMALVGGAGMFGLLKLMAPGSSALGNTGARESVLSVAVLLAWVYGMVCGAMLLANEHESGTMGFLDMLPARRLELWVVKFAFGMILFLGQVAVLTGVVLALDLPETARQFVLTFACMMLFGLLGLGWGLLFSARGDNVLNVIGLAFLGQIGGIIGIVILAMPLVIVLTAFWNDRDNPGTNLVAWVGLGVLIVGPFLVSARLYTLLDRQRGPRQKATKSVRRRGGTNVTASWHHLMWLTYRQMRRLLLGIVFFALLLGFVLPATGPIGWPVLSLILGVLCGVTVWMDEQFYDANRFLGDQRFPLARIWIVKVGLRFALAVFAAFLLLLPSLILAVFHRLEVQSLGQPRIPFFAELLHCTLVGTLVPAGIHLWMWLLYGFTMGQLCSMLFRKSLVAAVVSLGWAVTLAGLWLPSLVGIGLHFWQIAGVPLILLVTSALLMPDWAADRLLARRTFIRGGLALLLAALWMAGGLWYRIVEVPDVPDAFDMPAYQASVPALNYDQNAAGLAIRGVWSEAANAAKSLSDPALNQHLLNVMDRGWTAGDPMLDRKLDDVFKEEWSGKLAEAVENPLGAVEDVRLLTRPTRFSAAWGNAPAINSLLAVRGLQLQARGKPQRFVEYLQTGLALSRNLQHFGTAYTYLEGRFCEQIWLKALERWLKSLDGHPLLLKRVDCILRQHEEERPDEQDAVKAECLIVMNTLDETPAHLVEEELHMAHQRPPEDNELTRAQIGLAALLWRFPWEEKRHERLLRVAVQGSAQERQQAEAWGGKFLSNLDVRQFLRPRDKRTIADGRAMQLKIALRLYQVHHKKLPETLAELVPDYLPAIPADPFDDKPFRYRVSRGEHLILDDLNPAGPAAQFPNGADPNVPLPEPNKLVPPGRGILWAVGEDGHDDRGKMQGPPRSATSFGQDVIYLVPPPAHGK